MFSGGDIAILNIIFVNILFIMLLRSWGFVVLLIAGETLWVLLFVLTLSYCPIDFDVTYFTMSIICIIISGVELVVTLVSFIIYYHVTNYLTTSSLESKPLKFYVKELKKKVILTSKRF
jgi:hypothetical protein